MRKLNYSDPKIIELLEELTSQGFSFKKEKDSVEVQLQDVRADKKRIVHMLSQLNNTYKACPLITQVVEGDTVLSIYDQRV